MNLRRNRVEVDFDESVCDAHADPENEMIERQNQELAVSVLQSIPKAIAKS